MVTKIDNKNWIKQHPVWPGIIGFFLLLMMLGAFSDDSNSTGNIVNKPIEKLEECNPDWQCSSWSECGVSGIQRRTCEDVNDCGNLKWKPSETKSCEYDVPQGEKIEIAQKETEVSFDFDEWLTGFSESLSDLEESLGEQKVKSDKIKECTELCAGEDIVIPYIKSECSLSCNQIYYYGGEDSLDEFILEMKNE